MFYTFHQNNVKGFYINSPIKGIGQFVIIEADSKEEAYEKHKNLGIGIHNYTQYCNCCGDRWNTYSCDFSRDVPYINDLCIGEYAKNNTYPQSKTIYIHYKNLGIKKIVITGEYIRIEEF